MPAISVLLPVYNGEEFLRQAIDSILTQTYPDFRLVILNDASTDNSAQIIDSYDDPRIQVVHQTKNLGLSETLNRAIDANLDVSYIARMDQDDICLPHRFEKQVAYMERHLNVDVLATNVRFINENGEAIRNQCYTPGISGDYLLWRLHWGNPIIHPSTLIRTSTLKKSGVRYKADFYPADDYFFWLDIIKSGLKIDLCNEICLNYRIISTSISRQNKNRQLDKLFDIIQQQFIEKFGDQFSQISIQTLAAHFSQHELAEYDYYGAARLINRLALYHIFYRARTHIDQTYIFTETTQIFDEFIQRSDAQSGRKVMRIKKRFEFYIKHLSKVINRLPVFRFRVL